MTARYPEAFIEQALVKVFSRGERTITSIADDLNVNHHTLRYWMAKKSTTKTAVAMAHEKRPQDWTLGEQFAALQETHALSGEALQAWCREHGIFAHHLDTWKAAFTEPKTAPVSARETRTLKDENTALKRELARKEKALAEAAALLVLQKKFRALWEDKE